MYTKQDVLYFATKKKVVTITEKKMVVTFSTDGEKRNA
jgi:hypothetical protein